jgi:diguanylate cyclase (GGDEF)-like protein
MRLVSERNIAGVSFLYAVIVVGVMVFSTGALFIFNQIRTLNNDLGRLEDTFIRERKETLREDVNGLIAQIDSSRLGAMEQLRQQLKKRSDEALAIADNLYTSMQGQMDESETGNIIHEALRPIRYNEKQSYYFILDMEGESILNPIDRSAEGTNLLQSRNPFLLSAGRNFISIAREQGSGYIYYDWPKPGSSPDELFRKISYISLFEPLQWIIGTGEYLVNLDSLAKSSTIRDLRKNSQFYTDDYYFLYEVHDLRGGKDFATMLINSNRKDLEGKKISDDYVDQEENAFRKEFLEGIRQDGEAYVIYWYKKPDGSGAGRKLAFFKLYSPWNWVVARGVYLDRLDADIAAQKGVLADRVKKDILILCLVFLVAVTIALFVAYHFSRELQSIFDRYRKSQEQNYTELEALHKALEEQSRTDALTGIFNRGYFNRKLSDEIARTTRYQTPLSLILLDLDSFKHINDTFGHLVGDTVLHSLATLIKGHIRQSDIFARWGGEEFVILAPGVDVGEAGDFAEKIRNIVELHDFQVNSTITGSFGVTAYLPPESGITFLQRADDALYRAKEQGRNRCVIA